MKKIALTLLSLLEKSGNYFFTYHTRPKLSDDIVPKLKSSTDFEKIKVGIVMQGPIIAKDNLTLETLKLYVKYFGSHSLILSTWSDADPRVLDAIRGIGVDVVLSEQPEIAGVANINFQITSSTEGINRARALGCEYILKTRTDQRIYSQGAILFCYSAMKKFPLLIECAQNERIVSFNLNTFMYRPYGISDMINFGHIDDLTKYWCLPLDSRSHHNLREHTTLLGFSKQRLAEVYFVTSFIERVGIEIGWTLEDSWRVMTEHFCILNSNDIDLFWKKYTHKEFRHKSYNKVHNRQFDFSDWLVLYDQTPTSVPEHIINTPLEQLDAF